MLLILGIEFMSLSLAIVYIGGTLVLFLFMITSVGSEFRYVKEDTIVGVDKLVIVKKKRIKPISNIPEKVNNGCDSNEEPLTTTLNTEQAPLTEATTLG